MATWSPVKLDQKRELVRQTAEELDSLERSRRFYEEEYKGKDKKRYLNAVKSDIAAKRQELATMEYMPTLGELKRNEPEELEEMLALMLNDLRLFFQVDNVITTASLWQLIPLITETYPSLTLEDVALCLLDAKRGRYGEIYNRLDGAVILGWIKKYEEERKERTELKSYAREINHKESQYGERQSTGHDDRKLFELSKTKVMLDRAKKDGNKS